MASIPFGEHLRREREMRGVSLDEIAAATRIATRFLEALEQERWDQLPGGAFNRGFIRSVARFLGIDEDDLIAEYDYERKIVEEQSTSSANAAHPTEIPRNWRPIITAIAIALVLIAGGVFGARRYGASVIAKLHARFASAMAGTSVNAANRAPATTELAASSAPTNPPITSESPAADQELSLTILSRESSGLTVIADGKIAFMGSLRANDSKQIDAHESIELDTKDSAVLALSLNGQSIPWAAAPGASGKMIITQKDQPSAPEPIH
jgi:cytoskeletal protein RodZ